MPTNEISDRLTAARLRLGWSREALAYHSGVSWSAIAQIETGRRTLPRPDTLRALARALGVTVGYLVGEGRPVTLLAHRALIYGSEEAFVDAIVPFVTEGVERSEPVLVVTSTENAALLRPHLEAHDDSVTIADSREWYGSPLDALNAYRSFTDDMTGEGAAWIRIVGEPTWPGGSKRDARGWATYESMFNLVFASAPLTVVCPYHSRSSGGSVADVVRATHPFLDDGARVDPNPEYVDPEAFVFGGSRE